MAYGTQPSIAPRAEAISSTGVTLQIERFERLLTVQDQMLETLNQRLSSVMRPMNFPVATQEGTKAAAPESVIAEHMRILVSRLESHNERIIALIECADV